MTELCRRESIPTPVYYSWVKDFMEAGKSRLKRDLMRDASKGEVKDLRSENERLKILLADKELAISLLKKASRTPPDASDEADPASSPY
ncbi:MAG: hypothetical protein M0D55_04420 [Elusimicrobiota bacterium]|nr:MAG: hypothetical protein M0D55_04420 [Elusimicrobiota bacterium]